MASPLLCSLVHISWIYNFHPSSMIHIIDKSYIVYSARYAYRILNIYNFYFFLLNGPYDYYLYLSLKVSVCIFEAFKGREERGERGELLWRHQNWNLIIEIGGLSLDPHKMAYFICTFFFMNSLYIPTLYVCVHFPLPSNPQLINY